MNTIMYIQCTQIFKECTQFCIFNVHKSSMNVHNFVYLTHPIFQRMYTILYIHRTQSLKFYTQFCIFNINSFSKNLHNFVYSTYTIFCCVDIFSTNCKQCKVCTFNIQTFK